MDEMNPPEYDLFVTLEEIFTGCIKNVPIAERVSDINDSKNDKEGVQNYTVTVLPGVKSGTKIFFSTHGFQITEGLLAEIVFVVREKPHDVFERDDSDIIHTVKLSNDQASRDWSNIIQTLKGESLILNRSANDTNSSQKYAGFGFPDQEKTNCFGDLIVNFVIEPNQQTVHDVFVTLEEVLAGCTKHMKVNRKVLDSHSSNRLEELSFFLNIEPGVEEGTEIVFENEGYQNSDSDSANTVFVVRIEPHCLFEREGSNIVYTIQLSTKDAQSVRQWKIPTLEKETIYVNSSLDLKDRTIPNRGLPSPGVPNKRGDMIVKFKIEQGQNDQSEQTSTLEHDLFVTLEEILEGCKKTFEVNGRSFEIDVKPGSKAETRIQVNKDDNNQQDVLLIIKQTPHDYFRRENDDIVYTVELSQEDASRGVDKSIPTLEGDQVYIRNSKLNPTERKRIPNRGLPLVEDPNQRGDLVVEFKINQPIEKEQDTIPPSPIEHELSISLEEILKGCTKKMKVHKKVVDFDGNERQETKILNVTIEPGSRDGQRILFEKEGGNALGQTSADVVFIIQQIAHPLFKRQGNNIFHTIELNEEMLARPINLNIPTLDGENIQIENCLLDPRTVWSLPSLGLPYFEDPTKRGKLIVNLNVQKNQAKENELEQDPPVEHELFVTLEEVLQGCTKRVKIKRMAFDTNGLPTEEEKILSVRIEPGLATDTKLTFPQEGDRKIGRIAADIVFIVKDKKHPCFRRQGSDILYTAKYRPNRKPVQIPTLDNGETLDAIPALYGCPRYPGYGLPLPNNPSQRGDLVVQFEFGP